MKLLKKQMRALTEVFRAALRFNGLILTIILEPDRGIYNKQSIANRSINRSSIMYERSLRQYLADFFFVIVIFRIRFVWIGKEPCEAGTGR